MKIYGTYAGETLDGSESDDVIKAYAGDDTLNGMGGDDSLDGGPGADHMAGGQGDDTYYVDDTGDVVVENAGEGHDVVYTSLNYVLPDNVEDGVLLADGNFTLTGNALDNELTGNFWDNWIDGGAGADVMYGGLGSDTYVVDNGNDAVQENSAAGGQDTVLSSVRFVLPQYVENLILTGNHQISGVGNDDDNYIVGNGGANILRGGGGNDVIDGGAGADTMYGGTGNDSFYVDNANDAVHDYSGQGSDTIYASVSYSLRDTGAEALILTGNAKIDGTGWAYDDSIYGNDGRNHLSGGGGSDVISGNGGSDVLDGGTGADVMYGGSGDDTFYVDNTNDQVNGDSGKDVVYASVSFGLGTSINDFTSIETLQLTGTADINARGDAGDNALLGNAGANILESGGGRDVLNGGAGADIMMGGTGSDTYYVDNAGDVVQEVSNGYDGDLVYASISYDLTGTFIEDLVLTGNGNLNGTGNEFRNKVVGNSGDNRLDGGLGGDTLTGGLGADTFVYFHDTNTRTRDYITDFNSSEGDTIELHATMANPVRDITQVNDTVRIDFEGHLIYVMNATVSDVQAHVTIV